MNVSSYTAAGLEFVRLPDLLTYHLHHDRAHQTFSDYGARLARNKARFEGKWRPPL